SHTPHPLYSFFSILTTLISILILMSLLFIFMLRLPPTSSLFPYTTLFRSAKDGFSDFRWSSAESSSVQSPACCPKLKPISGSSRSEEHTSELQSRFDLGCRLLLEKKKSANGASDFLCD